ncbi:uncharacterized protein G2W53_026456 [Senna tora]|uniref:Uncharacterized protein n=1 Tax=Senna tora TaxID=362788 RepID=A0A834WIV1_9FABA|nr:uncharacterized protein G2W53_026456 [Senna tora]
MLQLESSWHGRNVDHVLTYSGRQIKVGSLKPSRITRQKTCCTSELDTSVCFLFANRSGFDAPIGVVMAWEERGSCLNIFRKINQCQISETFTNYDAKHLLRKAWENRGSCLNIFWKTNCGWISETFKNYEAKHLLRKSVPFVFANKSGFDARIGVVMALEERASSLNIFQTTNPGRISETFTNYEAKDLLRKSVPFVFANQSGFDARIGVVMALEERASSLNIFQMTNCGQISETFTIYEAKHLLRKSVDDVLTYSGRQIAVGSLKPSRITWQKTCCASE